MSDDRKLLELAAKAIGLDATNHPAHTDDWSWNPLNDDSDALRLAVKLEFTISTWGEEVAVWQGDSDGRETFEPITTDRLAATRRAIVRAASEIERSMK